MLTDTILALFIAFFACAALCPIMIPILHRMKFGQQARDDGPQSHLKESETPTMGGIMIVLTIALGCLPFLKKMPETPPVMGFALVFRLIGFLDDFLKTHREQSEGLKAWQKFSLQLTATGVLAYRLSRTGNYGDILLPFSGSFEIGILLPLGGLFVPFIFLAVLSADNGVNFTDGLDRLYSSVTTVVVPFFTTITCRFAPGTASVSGAIIGVLLDSLLFNYYLAKVFVGDAGTLALSGHATAVALVLRMPLFLILVGTIYTLGVISVVLQVGYFKAAKGKWLFQMAPLRHHFELGGWPETYVVTIFTMHTVILSLVAWIGFGE